MEITRSDATYQQTPSTQFSDDVPFNGILYSYSWHHLTAVVSSLRIEIDYNYFENLFDDAIEEDQDAAQASCVTFSSSSRGRIFIDSLSSNY